MNSGPYVVLARKYRSKQFNDIVGQQSVVRTLVNAIKLKRTHQAYVFSGSRGIGKTSIARIFSKTLRCPNVIEKDGLLFSCDNCPDCKEIAVGNSVNVLEIDGASNNGVDAVREIRENAKFLPTSGQYKIYIIDEVHMLSTAAFNALLKTLEEPPEHVVFIFATTESHKIPETILGRCQRFDFKRMTIAQIADRCKEVLTAEKIDFEDAALNLIARAAEGSMRDALSILDQVISFSGLKVTAKAVRDSIGLVGTELVYALLKNILDRDAKSALTVVQGAFAQGIDLKVLLKVMIEMLHSLILIQVGIDRLDTHFNDDELKQIASLKTARPIEENELIFQVFHHGLDLLSRAAQPKLVFDLLVVKTAFAEQLVPVDRGLPQSPSLKTEEVRAPSAKPAVPSWESFIEKSFEIKPVLAVILESAVEHTLPAAAGETLRLGFRAKDKAKADSLQQKNLKAELISLFESQFGIKPVIEVFSSENNSESVVERTERMKSEARDQKVKSILANEVVQEAKALFGGDLTQIEIFE
ncbi:MAG: DNA polymerase III subunit gamma/tau [Bdellovibrionales bacterium]|nr:DNA polymerase III subunit gamma/tau [Bdellovibrionales bacterium]